MAAAVTTTTNNTTASTSPDMEVPNLPSPPWLKIDGVSNFRDIGGYPISAEGASGKKSVRRGLVFRSAEPGKVTPEGKRKVCELGIATMYDLRSEEELKRLGDMADLAEIDGVERVFVPVHDYSPEALAERYRKFMSGEVHIAYASMLNQGPTAYRTIFTHLLQNPSDPLLIHCTAGKDRTGVVCALILLLAGVSDDIIAKEYALTTLGLTAMREKIIQYLMKDTQSLANGGRAGAENMLSSEPETMHQFLQILRDEFGGVEGYLSGHCGFSSEEIERIRQNVICDDDPAVVL